MIDTRGRILDAAERLFAEHGLEATSMRRITAAAGCNLASVNYHFGGKEGLIREVFRRRLTWLNRERLRVLDEMEAAAAGRPLKPHLILEAFFGVALRMTADTEGGGALFMRLLGRTYAEPSQFIRNFLAEEYAAVLERFKRALFRALPAVPEEEIVWRLHFMLGAMSYAIAGTDSLRLIAHCGSGGTDSGAALAPRLMSFLLGGLRAPLPAGCTAQPARPAAKRTRRVA
ncbi:MAG: TetR/AcrR family transcriptional regulator [Rhodocyclaceae bacterium]